MYLRKGEALTRKETRHCPKKHCIPTMTHETHKYNTRAHTHARAHTHTHSHARTSTYTHARARAHAPTHPRTHTHTMQTTPALPKLENSYMHPEVWTSIFT